MRNDASLENLEEDNVEEPDSAENNEVNDGGDAIACPFAEEEEAITGRRVRVRRPPSYHLGDEGY